MFSDCLFYLTIQFAVISDQKKKKNWNQRFFWAFSLEKWLKQLMINKLLNWLIFSAVKKSGMRWGQLPNIISVCLTVLNSSYLLVWLFRHVVSSIIAARSFIIVDWFPYTSHHQECWQKRSGQHAYKRRPLLSGQHQDKWLSFCWY